MITKNKLIGLSILLLALVIPQIQAVTINSGTIYNSTASNLKINFTDTRYADTIIISNESIWFKAFRLTDETAETITFNITEGNATYKHTALPYYSSSSDTSKTITSTLTQTITSDIQASITRDCKGITKIVYTPNGGSQSVYDDDSARDLCSSGIITLQEMVVANGANSLAITYYSIDNIVCQGIIDAYSVIPDKLPIILSIIALGAILTLLMGLTGKIEFNAENLKLAGFATIFLGLIFTYGLEMVKGACT